MRLASILQLNNKQSVDICVSYAGENVVGKKEELTEQLDKDRIELISFHILEEMVQDIQYLAVYFCKFVKFITLLDI